MKRTLEHCGLITRMGDKDSPPNQHGGRCDGYAVSETNDEPCYICKGCKLNTFYEEHNQCGNYTGSSREELERLYYDDDSEGGLISED